MKALYLTQKGGSEALVYDDLPDPVIEDPMDVIVRVRAAGMNRLDVMQRAGTHGATPLQYPFISGKEFAGDVVEVGSQVTGFKPGDRIYGATSRCYAELTRVRLGGRIHQDAAELIPEGLSYEEAASIPTSTSMAFHMLHCDGKLRSEQDVLIMGGGSGTGVYGIQFAKAAGARVITTAGSDEKLEKAKALGADEVINHREMPEFSARVRELTGGQGVDLVFEHIGTPVWESCFASLRRRGRLVICGVTAGHWVKLHLGQLWSKELGVIGSTNYPEEDFNAIARLVERGLIHGVVDSVFPLDKTAEAQKRMESGDFFGKIVLTVS